MRTLLTICCLAFVAQTYAQNQVYGDVHASPAKTRTYSERELKSMQDGVFMRKGRMFVVSQGTEQSMYEPMTMLDGTKVQPDGSYLKLDGTKHRLHDDERMFLSGQITAVPHTHFVTLKNNKMWVVRDTINILMDREYTLENGSKVYPEGYAIHEGKKVAFAEGDRMNLSGVWMEPEQLSYSNKPAETSSK